MQQGFRHHRGAGKRKNPAERAQDRGQFLHTEEVSDVGTQQPNEPCQQEAEKHGHGEAGAQMSGFELRDLDHGWADPELREVLRQSDHHQRCERQVLAALDDFGHAVDRYYLVFQLVGARIDFLNDSWHYLLTIIE